MELTTSQIQFIKDHATDDLTRLLLSAAKYPGMDIPFLVDQIAVRRQIREKLPSWFENGQLVFPAKIAAEQCSSEQTAAYKQELIGESWTICDLTGGLGVDSWAFSEVAEEVLYNEMNPALAAAARHNFKALGVTNIFIRNSEATSDSLKDIFGDFRPDVIFLDPARRDSAGKKVFLLEDCSPDVLKILPELFGISRFVLLKLSPMADITMAVERLDRTYSTESVYQNR